MRSEADRERYRVQDLLIDAADAFVRRGDERIVLPPRTFELLLLPVRRHPHLVRRHEILDAVWPDEHVTEQTLTHRVLLLRQALGDHAESPRYVAGERGFGYRLIGPVERIREPEDAPPRPSRVLHLSPVGVAAALLLLINLDPRGAGRAGEEVTIAVKPFASDGLPGELRSVAAEIGDPLHARIARTEGFRPTPWREGSAGPSLWFEGRLGTVGDRLELSLRLVDGASGGTAWSRTLTDPGPGRGLPAGSTGSWIRLHR